jgi:hypothetical protein
MKFVVFEREGVEEFFAIAAQKQLFRGWNSGELINFLFDFANTKEYERGMQCKQTKENNIHREE